MKRNNKALYEQIMRNVSREVRKTLNEGIQSQDFKPFKVNMLLSLEDEEDRDNLFADLDPIKIDIKPNPYGEHYPEKLVIFTITNVDELKEWTDFFKYEIDFVTHLLANDDNDDDSLEFQIENENGRRAFRSAVRKYIEPKPSKEERLLKRCADKLNNSINGGDYNEILYCMQDGNIEGARAALRDINRFYSKRVFSTDEMNCILTRWDEIYNIL